VGEVLVLDRAAEEGAQGRDAVLLGARPALAVAPLDGVGAGGLRKGAQIARGHLVDALVAVDADQEVPVRRVRPASAGRGRREHRLVILAHGRRLRSSRNGDVPAEGGHEGGDGRSLHRVGEQGREVVGGE
jgi:hypothetical protein